MLTKEELDKFWVEARDLYLDHISIDCVVFGFHEGQMKVLMLKSRNEEAWYLPGGFVLKEEPIDTAANRILKIRTGIDEVFLQQFRVLATPTVPKSIMKCIRTLHTQNITFLHNDLYQ